MAAKTSFIAIYIKDAQVMGMRIPRPIITRENNRLYGNAFEMTQHEQHLYECVQPLQGRITFADRLNDPKYRNNFSWVKREIEGPDVKGESVFGRIETLLLFFVLGLVILFCTLWASFSNQFALNKVFMTQFVVDGASYKMEDAGFTKPVDCFAIALVLISTSLLVGWQSNRGLAKFHPWVKTALSVSIAVLQILALVMHIIIFASEEPKAMSFTSSGVFSLHLISSVLTLAIFWFIGGLPDSRPDKSFETENNFWLCVVGDLNLIVCYALIYRACDSQISIHDDVSTFFDVVCIVLIGFLQHIANILMIFHAHIQNSNPKEDTIHNITRTRMLLFFMIGAVTIFLYLRISPTYTEYPAGVPFELTRSLALIAFISMNSLHSLRYELDGSKSDAFWESTPTWKLMTTAFIAVGSGILLVVFVYEYKDDNTFKLLNAITT